MGVKFWLLILSFKKIDNEWGSPLEFQGNLAYNDEVMNGIFSISMHLSTWVTRKGYPQGVLSDLER